MSWTEVDTALNGTCKHANRPESTSKKYANGAEMEATTPSPNQPQMRIKLSKGMKGVGWGVVGRGEKMRMQGDVDDANG